MEEKKQFDNVDPGSGTRYFRRTKRIINPDGSFNVNRNGIRFSPRELYLYLTEMSWARFLGLTLLVYIFINAVFASLYMICGIEHLVGAEMGNWLQNFLQCFFFSVQTFTTVGYGHISPMGVDVNLIASLEALIGLLGFALATGLVYGRFSRPSSRIMFSKNAIIAPLKDGRRSFQFRIVNHRKNQIMEMNAEVILKTVELKNGTYERRYHRLKLMIPSILFFPLTWTIVHEIDEESPLYGKTHDDLMKLEAEFLVLLKGFDETFSQHVHSRYSYLCEEVIQGARFKRAFDTDEMGNILLNIHEVHDYERVELPPMEKLAQTS